MMFLIGRTFFLSFLASTAVQGANMYTEEGTGREVLAYSVPLPDTASNMSHAKCIEYKTGAGRDYESACLSIIYNKNDVVIGCSADFDTVDCNWCKPCQSNELGPNDTAIVGFSVDCNNKNPGKNVLSTCNPYDDDVIQEYLLVKGHFDDTAFNFSAPAPGAAGAEGGDKSDSSLFRGIVGTLMATVLAIVL